MCKQRVGSTIELRSRDNIVPRSGDGQDGIVNRCHTRANGQCCNSSFHGGESLFKHIVGRIHNPRVNISGHCQVEQIRSVLGIIKLIGDCLENRHRN